MNRLTGTYGRRRPALAALLLLSLLGLMTTARPAAAHPLGNFSVNTYSRLEPAAGGIRLLYIVDMAEIPAFQERSVVDLDGDATISAAEKERYAADQAAQLLDGLGLQVNGRPVELTLDGTTLEFPPGQGGLATQRLTLRLASAAPGQDGPWRVEYRDDNYRDRLGWREVVVRPASGVTLLETSVPGQDLSDELRRYPEDLLQSPLRVREATFRFAATAEPDLAAANVVPAATAGPTPFNGNHLGELIAVPVLGPGALALAMVAAFGWGAAHAFTPGHGKTIVAAYLVGSRGTARHALLLGLTTTTTHTLGVFGLGLAVLFASRFVRPELLYPWLGVLSGILVVSIGLSLSGQRLRGLRRPHLAGGGHDHDHDGHDHEQGHNHHDHGQHHHHRPPVTDDSPVTWRGLVALGISGGLLPCPSALVLMLGAIALQRVGVGLALIVAFSVGLASVLTAVGLVMVYAGRLFARLPAGRGRGGLARAVPVGSALFIVAAGLAITARALVETGLLP